LRRSYPRTYDRFRPLKIIVVTLICLCLAAVILFTAMFFSLRRHVAYDADGELYLDIPWRAEYMHPDDTAQ